MNSCGIFRVPVARVGGGGARVGANKGRRGGGGGWGGRERGGDRF